MTAVDRYPSYRAPQANGEVLCLPRWSTLPQQVAAQRSSLDSSSVKIALIPLADLAREARELLVSESHWYTSNYAQQRRTELSDGPIVITGHQPELFHPGVWLKNFAAARLAAAIGGVAINLVIDNDLCRTPSVRVPTGTAERPQVVDVPFDTFNLEMPYEQRSVVDKETWRSFGDRATAAIAPLIARPLIADWWKSVSMAAEPPPKLGQAIARSRHLLELEWGSQTSELPQSYVCASRPFRLFATHLLSNAGQFRAAYNGALAEYRQQHRLRSPAQPLPDLQQSEDWTETPFWIWSNENPTRRALYAQAASDGVRLSDRAQWHDLLPSIGSKGSDEALEKFAVWEQSGVKIRSRALTTTLYARLLLADTFIHGIGGAKYDQVTDEICRRFFEVELPSYVTISGTLRLPVQHAEVGAEELSDLKRRVREFRYHPEKHLDHVTVTTNQQAEIDRWVSIKKQWVQTPKTKGNAAERHRQIIAANTALHDFLQPKRVENERKLAVTFSQIRANQLLETREYPFCLFPRAELQDFLLDFSSRMP